MSNPQQSSTGAIAIVTPLNVVAGAVVTAANAITCPVLIYGTTDDGAGGKLILQYGATISGPISFFGGGGEFHDLSGVAGSYRFYGGGGGNLVSFAQGSTNAVCLHGAASQWNTVVGTMGVATVDSGSASFVGGGDTIHAAAGSWLSLYDTNGVADIVDASSAFLILNGVEAQVCGGGDNITLTAPSTMTLSGGNGAWDSVVGNGATVHTNGVNVSIGGGGETISASAGTWM